MKSKKAKQKEKRLKEENQRTQAFIWILPFLISLIFFNVLPNEKESWSNYIGTISLLVMMLSFYKFINSLRILINIYIPVTNSNKKNHKFFKILNTSYIFIFSFVMFLISLFFGEPMSNQNHIPKIAFIGLIGTIISLLILWFLFPGIYMNETRRFNLLFRSFIGIPLLTIAVTLILNKVLAGDVNYCENVEIIAKEISIGGRNRTPSYDITFILNDFEHEESVNEEQYILFNIGDKVEICLIEGYFGYDILESIEDYNPKWEK